MSGLQFTGLQGAYLRLMERVWVQGKTVPNPNWPLETKSGLILERPSSAVAAIYVLPQQSQLAASLRRCQEIIAREISSPVWLQPEQALHVSIFKKERYTPRQEGQPIEASRIAREQAIFSRFQSVIRGLPEVEIEVQGLVLAPDGTIMARGFYDNRTVEIIRRSADTSFKMPQDELFHFTLARVMGKTEGEDFRDLYDFIRSMEKWPGGKIRMSSFTYLVESRAMGSDYIKIGEFQLANKGLVLDKKHFLSQIGKTGQLYFASGRSRPARDQSLLEGILQAVYTSHNAITPAQASAFKALIRKIAAGKKDVCEAFHWLEKNTWLGSTAVAPDWPMAKKTDSGDGPLGQGKKPDDFLEYSQTFERHLRQMIQAGQAIIRGEYSSLYRSAYQLAAGEMAEETTPDLSPGLLETGLAALRQEDLPRPLLEYLYLALLLHDYAKILDNNLAINPEEIRPDANQHRIAGAYLAADLLTKIDLPEFGVAVVQLLIRQHDTAWNLYCREKYRAYNNYTTPNSLKQDIKETISGLKQRGLLPGELAEEALESALRKMIAIVGLADVHASGDRYWSDSLIKSVLAVLASEQQQASD